jgi:hypothetical protein
MTNKAFTNGVGLTRNGPKQGDFLTLSRANGKENFAARMRAALSRR